MNPWALATPNTLFGRAALTLTIAFVLFLVLTLGAVAYYLLVPVATRSADDLAAIMVLAAQTWVELPPHTREDFSYELYRNHNIWLTTTDTPVDEGRHPLLPYLSIFEAALAKRTGVELPVRTKVIDGRRWFWVDMSMANRDIRVGFPQDRIGTQPPIALVLVVLGSALVVLLTAMVLTRRITRPLILLSDASRRVGKGQLPEPLPESGPKELASLAQQFNRMAQQVRNLLANRTTLLAGISHDLRTPLARMRLALEMLPEPEDPQLVVGLRRDLEEMNELIGQFLELSRELEAGHTESTDVATLLADLIADMERGPGVIELTPCPPCIREVNTKALRRILSNLVGNALHYGRGAPITIVCSCSDNRTEIRVLDRGPGIPADQKEAVFRPFYRLERSRSSDTGGSGLGLAIARQLADASGWTIRLLDREGGGTDAQVLLPS